MGVHFLLNLEDMEFSGWRQKIKSQTKELFIYQHIDHIKDILKESELRKHIRRSCHLEDGLQMHL